MKRKQEKEREAAGLGPLVRQGANAAKVAQNGRGGPSGRGGTAGRGRGTPAVANAAVRGAGTFGPVRSGMRGAAAQDKQLWVHLVSHSYDQHTTFRLSKDLILAYADWSVAEEGTAACSRIFVLEKAVRGECR